MKRFRFLLVCGTLLSFAFPSLAERFGDLTVVPQPFASGETYHGYREYRILLENQSKDAHRVTLVFPDHPYSYGNSISRLSRTISLAPATRAVVPLWQPPLPIGGDSLVRVVVDDENVGSVNLPGNSHMTRSGPRYGGATPPATVLVSRTLNYDDWARSLKSDRTDYSARMATGAPDSTRARGVAPTAWMPDSSSSGPHWLEVDFDKPIQAERLNLFETLGVPPGGEILLIGVSGTNVGRALITPVGGTRPGTGREFLFPLTPEPVKTVRINFNSAYAGSISIDAVELKGPSESTWAASARASSESTAGSPSYPGAPSSSANQILRAEVPVAEWSEAWLSYTPYDAIAFSAADLRSMPPAVQSALWRYTECGGNLFILGEAPIPDAWRAAPRETVAGGTRFDAGFGRCFLFQSEQISALPLATVKTLSDALASVSRTWQSLPDENAANASFPVIENVRIPVRGIVFIMLAFVIVIGPVNIIVLSRMNRRTWLLWTIPVISMFTSFVVFAYSFLREGVTSDVRIEGLTLLDQGNRRAATIGATAFYCPLTPSQGLFFGNDTEATPLVESYDYRRGTQREVDWTQSQQLQRGWVTARVPAYFYLRRTETRRERLQVEGAGAQLVVVNGLGASIRSLWLADKSGKIYLATNIVAGQKANLVGSVESPNVSQKLGARELSEKIGFTQLKEFDLASAPSYLLPGTYIAELDSNPFLENGLGAKAKSARKKSRSLVYGILETSYQP
jgi:hypothetical protein